MLKTCFDKKCHKEFECNNGCEAIGYNLYTQDSCYCPECAKRHHVKLYNADIRKVCSRFRAVPSEKEVVKFT